MHKLYIENIYCIPSAYILCNTGLGIKQCHSDVSFFSVIQLHILIGEKKWSKKLAVHFTRVTANFTRKNQPPTLKRLTLLLLTVLIYILTK